MAMSKLKQFQGEREYNIGVLLSGKNGDDPNPYRQSPAMRTLTGQQLFNMGVRTANDLWKLNPLGLKPNMTYLIQELNENGLPSYFGQGTVLQEQIDVKDDEDDDGALPATAPPSPILDSGVTDGENRSAPVVNLWSKPAGLADGAQKTAPAQTALSILHEQLKAKELENEDMRGLMRNALSEVQASRQQVDRMLEQMMQREDSGRQQLMDTMGQMSTREIENARLASKVEEMVRNAEMETRFRDQVQGLKDEILKKDLDSQKGLGDVGEWLTVLAPFAPAIERLLGGLFSGGQQQVPPQYMGMQGAPQSMPQQMAPPPPPPPTQGAPQQPTGRPPTPLRMSPIVPPPGAAQAQYEEA